MRQLHILYAFSPIVEQTPAPYMGITQQALPPPPLRLLRSLLASLASCRPCGSALPSGGAIFFPFTCTIRMADMPLAALSTSAIEFILAMLLRRAPYPPPSDPASQHRAAIVSSSLDQGSPAERISSSLALCLYFGFGFGPVIGPVFGWGLFFAQLRPPQLKASQEPRHRNCIDCAVTLRRRRLTQCRCANCMAVMLT
jgi:hypothetical protein